MKCSKITVAGFGIAIAGVAAAVGFGVGSAMTMPMVDQQRQRAEWLLTKMIDATGGDWPAGFERRDEPPGELDYAPMIRVASGSVIVAFTGAVIMAYGVGLERRRQTGSTRQLE